MWARKLKNFHDAKKKSALTTERYVSAKFVQGEFRSSADNKVDLNVEQCMTVNGTRCPLTVNYHQMTYQQFINLVRPAFHKEMERLDIEAVLRRCTIIVNTNWWLYVRPAGTEDEHTIERYSLKSKKYIKQDALDLLKKWFETGQGLPQQECERMIQEEQLIFRKALYPERFEDEPLEEIPLSQSAMAQNADTEPVATESGAASSSWQEVKSRRRPLLEVKAEYIEEVFYAPNRSLAMEGVIDCEARKKKRTRTTELLERIPDDMDFPNQWLHDKHASFGAQQEAAIVISDDDGTAGDDAAGRADDAVELHAGEVAHVGDADADEDPFGFGGGMD